MSASPPELPEFIYKITTAPLWAQAERTGVLPGMPIDDADGYMHFSTADQLGETLGLHFRGQSEIFVLKVALGPIAAHVKWEPSRGGALFPHLYAPLQTAHIVKSWPVRVDENGQTNLPDLS